MIPLSLVPPSLIFPSSTLLKSVDGKPIQTFGHCSTMIGVKTLRRAYKVDFIITNTKPILGADFLIKTGLQLDMKHRRLRDPLANISATLTTGKEGSVGIRVAEATDQHDFIKKNCPSILCPPDYSEIPRDMDTFHKIETSGPPVFSKPRPLDPKKLEVAKNEFENLMKLGIVRPSSSPWSSPLHMVKKSDGTWRPCGDYRRLNAMTTPDRYSIPNIQTIHYKLRGSQIFSRLDLVKAYHFVPMAHEDIEKTAICTPFGTYEYIRMPFGLRNAANSFQRFIDNILRGFSFVVSYIDDLLIFF